MIHCKTLLAFPISIGCVSLLYLPKGKKISKGHFLDPKESTWALFDQTSSYTYKTLFKDYVLTFKSCRYDINVLPDGSRDTENSRRLKCALHLESQMLCTLLTKRIVNAQTMLQSQISPLFAASTLVPTFHDKVKLKNLCSPGKQG